MVRLCKVTKKENSFNLKTWIKYALIQEKNINRANSNTRGRGKVKKKNRREKKKRKKKKEKTAT